MAAPATNPVVYFDGTSSRRNLATLAFTDALEISVDGETKARWPFADLRRADSAPGTLRVACQSAPPLARLEVRDPALAAELTSRAANLDEHRLGRRGVVKIVGWSLAAAASIVLVVLFGVPLAADRLAPLVPESFERRFGDITGSSAMIFASRTLATSSYSREAETAADTFSIAVMQKLGRPPKAMGELMLRVTGKEGGKGLTIISTHPLTEDRLARMSKEDQTERGPPLLSDAEWQALKSICVK